MDEIALVEIQDLSYAYGGAEGADVLSGCSLNVDAGELVLIAGPSGCGKSTLLRAVAGLVPHFYGGRMSGNVRVDGRDTKDLKPADLAGTVGFVFQDPEAQIVASTVRAELLFGLQNLGVPPREMEMRIEEALAAMNASDLIGRASRELSGGELQRVTLAAVLALQPKVLVLDEPTSQLDPGAAEALFALMRLVNEEAGMAVLLAEHRLERCHHWADRVVIMDEGRIVCDQRPRRAARWALDHGSPFVPAVAKLFANGQGVNLPLTVKEGRAVLARRIARAEELAGQPVDPPRPVAAADSPGADSPIAIEVRDLHYVYPNGIEALTGCDLSVRTGESICIMGENGAGKSTLVRHFNGLARSPRGSVKLFGKSVNGTPTEDLARICGLLGQNPNDYLFSDTVRGELEFSLANLRPEWDRAARDDAIERALDVLGIASLTDADPRSLSAGQRQRVALASVLVAEPAILVLDEPTRGMDYGNKEDLARRLRRLQADGKTIVLVTHDVEFAASVADRVVVVARGRTIADGQAREVMDRTIFLSPQVSRVMRDVAPGVVTVEDGRAVLRGIADLRQGRLDLEEIADVGQGRLGAEGVAETPQGSA